MHITDLKPDERSAAQERAEKEEGEANFMIRSVVLADQYLIAAEDQGKHVTLDELNKAAAELETFHENMVAASGMIVPFDGTINIREEATPGTWFAQGSGLVATTTEHWQWVASSDVGGGNAAGIALEPCVARVGPPAVPRVARDRTPLSPSSWCVAPHAPA